MTSDAALGTAPEGFKISKAIRDGLPNGERENARQHLWSKAGGLCAICDRPLQSDGKQIDVDHNTSTDDGGLTRLANLYLAHRACNRSRKNLPFDVAKRVIKFQRWCASSTRRSFGDVVSEYISNPNQRVTYAFKDDLIEVSFDQLTRTAGLSRDPATDTPYFFMDVPVAFVRNDDESQPRWIEHDHVRTLAIDFNKHPVHEPSNCRLVPEGTGPGVADLLQFDGQHKTTAQIILGRNVVPMKVYVDPAGPMIQELVVQIQQGIKKRPLSTTDTLRKLDDVITDKVDAFTQTHGRAPTEIELVAAQPAPERNAFKKRLIENFEWAILNDETCVLKQYAATKNSRDKPFTDKVVIRRLIKPLVSQELVAEPLDAADKRDTERLAVIRILNQIAEYMLVGKWDPKPHNEDESLQMQRARNFFYQAAIGFWLGEILLEAMKLFIPKAQWKRMLLAPLTADNEEKIDSFIEILCEWPIWSAPSPDQVAALRSNTVPNVVKAFPDHDQTRLIKEAQNAE